MHPFKPVPPSLWQGKTVFILGGGPSVTTEALHLLSLQEVVVGVNDAGIRAKTDFLFSLDRTWINIRKDEMNYKYQGGIYLAVKESDPIDYAAYPRANWLVKVHTGSGWPGPSEVHGYDSGFGALVLAAHGGANRIVLVGFDMQSRDGRDHWHHGYHWGQGQPNTRYKRWAEQFDAAAGYFSSKGIAIINTCLDSQIMAYPKIPLAEVMLPNATSDH